MDFHRVTSAITGRREQGAATGAPEEKDPAGASDFQRAAAGHGRGGDRRRNEMLQ